MKIFLDIIFNLGTIIMFGIIPSFIGLNIRNRFNKLLLFGFLFGLGAIIGMFHPVILQPGLFFDGRSILISLAGLFFGPIPAILSAIMVIAVRLYIGGIAAINASIVILSTATLGIIFFQFRKKESDNFSVKYLFLFGFLVHLVMVFILFALPGVNAISTIKSIGLPIIIIYPLATVVLGKILSLVITQSNMMIALKESEDKYRNVIDNANEAILVAQDGLIKFVNHKASSYIGYPEQELINKSFLAYIYPEDRDMIINNFNKRLARESLPDRYAFRVFTIEGSVRWVEISSALIDWQGKPATLNFLTDISERKNIEEQLINSNNLLHRIINLLPIRIFWKNKDLKYLGCNEIFAKDAGKNDEEDLIGQDDFQMNWKEQAVLYRADDQAVMETGIPKLNFEEPQTTPKGDLIWLKTSKVPLTDLLGTTIGILGVYEDITDQKLIENSLRESEEKYRTLVDNANESILVIQDGYIKYLNQKTIDLIGYSREELLEKPFPAFIHPDDREMVVNNYKRRLIGEKIQPQYEFRVLTAKKEIMWAVISATLISWQGKLATLNFIIEITDRKKAEEALQKLNEELETKVRQRTIELENSNKDLEAFSNSISHDLRAPLRAIDGFSQILKNQFQTELGLEGSNMVDLIVENTSYMNRLIKGMMAISKISGGEIKKILIEMNRMVNTVYREVVSKDDQERMSFIVEPLEVGYGDPTLLNQVWVNCLENAVKFSRKKEHPMITIRSFVEDQQIVYSVQDNGVGFNPQYQKKLFQMFQRLHSSQEFEGTGIGLAIVERIIRRHGGKVWAEGEEGVGATFYFSLPQFSNKLSQDI